MLQEPELENAVEIQARCYDLLLWAEQAIGRGFIRFDRVHRYTSDADAAQAWLSEQYLNLPERCRPLAAHGRPLTEFARVFASYLRTSFDLQPRGYRIASDCGCTCPMCGWLVALPYLKAKKVMPREKRLAQTLKRTYLESLMREQGVLIDATQIDRMLDDDALSRSAALCSYGRELLRCVEGQGLPSTGRLALWREFAWSKHGSPIPKFRLRAGDILRAEAQLLAALGDRDGSGRQ